MKLPMLQRIRGFGDNALYKSTFYLLTYLLCYVLPVLILSFFSNNRKPAQHSLLFRGYAPQRHNQQTNTQLFTGWMPFLSPNQQCQSTEGWELSHHVRHKHHSVRIIMLRKQADNK